MNARPLCREQSTETYKDGYMLSAFIFGLFIILPPWVTFFTNKERYQSSQVRSFDRMD
jgi:hypothetical protein